MEREREKSPIGRDIRKRKRREHPKSIKMNFSCYYLDKRRYERGMNQRDALLFTSNSERANTIIPKKEVSVITFNDFETALEVSRFLSGLDHPNIPKYHGFYEKRFKVVVDRIPPIPILQWIDYEVGEVMWSLDSVGKNYLELKEIYYILFRSIVRTLFYLHSRGFCHGNLLHGIWVTELLTSNIHVSFANFDMQIDFSTGLYKDLVDLKSLVVLAVKKHSYNIKLNGQCPNEPPALQAFYDLYIRMERYKNNLEKMRKYSIFVYWAPIFYSWKERRDFLNVVERFSMQDFEQFQTDIIFDRRGDKKENKFDTIMDYSMPRMIDWKDKVMNLDTNHPLRRLFDYSKKSRAYKDSGGIYWFHRNSLHHYKSRLDKDFDQAAMEDLLQMFPGALSVIFDRLMQKFSHGPVEEFSKSLGLHLKEHLSAS